MKGSSSDAARGLPDSARMRSELSDVWLMRQYAKRTMDPNSASALAIGMII
jgi:hypothetical protein